MTAAEALKQHTDKCPDCWHTANYKWTRCDVGMELLRALWAEQANPTAAKRQREQADAGQAALW